MLNLIFKDKKLIIACDIIPTSVDLTVCVVKPIDSFDSTLSYSLDSDDNIVTVDLPIVVYDDIINTQYQRDRLVEYNKLNQFDLQFNDSINGTTTWIEAINEIKLKFPKPVS